MKDAFGGIMNVFIIAIFFVLLSAILAMIVNYSKAFRMKNAVISAIEQYDSYGCFSSNADTSCMTRIKDYAKSIGYNHVELTCSKTQGYENQADLFCWKEVQSSSKNYVVYRVITQVDLDFPIISRIMNAAGVKFFQVQGDTRVIKK